MNIKNIYKRKRVSIVSIQVGGSVDDVSAERSQVILASKVSIGLCYYSSLREKKIKILEKHFLAQTLTHNTDQRGSYKLIIFH